MAGLFNIFFYFLGLTKSECFILTEKKKKEAFFEKNNHTLVTHSKMPGISWTERSILLTVLKPQRTNFKIRFSRAGAVQTTRKCYYFWRNVHTGVVVNLTRLGLVFFFFCSLIIYIIDRTWRRRRKKKYRRIEFHHHAAVRLYKIYNYNIFEPKCFTAVIHICFTRIIRVESIDVYTIVFRVIDP